MRARQTGAVPRVVTALAFVAVLATHAAPATAAPFEPAAVEARACRSHPDLRSDSRPVPAELREALAGHLADPRLAGVGVGLSVWVEGWGEVLGVNPALRLRPASNQKILTAMAALDVLGPETRFETSVVAGGPVADGAVHGDLYLVGGGDPTLRRTGAHSLETLAAAVRDLGIDRVAGDLVVDETRYDAVRRANGWSELVAPRWVGSLSAFVVDENRTSAWAADLADPATANARLALAAFLAAGIAVDGEARAGAAPEGATPITRLASAPLRDVVRLMLVPSNNTIAELLVKELGYRAVGDGSTADGLAVLASVAQSLCLPQAIVQHDGSGLSRGNARTAADWRRLLQAAQSAGWWEDFVAALPVAAETGTLRSRFRGTAAAGNLRAKTGTITGVRSLSGLLTTAGGRRVFFSAIVEDDDARAAMAAIDDLLVTIATSDA